MRTQIVFSAFIFSLLVSLSLVGVEAPVQGRLDGARAPAVVIGFVGGFVRHDDLVHSEVGLAARLRSDYPGEVQVEAFENGRGNDAYRKVLDLLDTSRDGKLSVEEKRSARILIYGHSWGGSEAINLARQLGDGDIPVLLTIQVDSVTKMGENDTVIPPNVAQAVNFYQLDGFLHGHAKIVAADAGRTQILGNYRMNYKDSPLHCDGYPWWDRLVMKQHTQIECDPRVWSQVEALIRSRLPAPPNRAAIERPLP